MSAYDLSILFPTSFSDACFQTGRAIAQLADRCRVHLTIVHVAPAGSVAPGTRRELASFFAEGDHYDQCRRILLESNEPASAVATFGAREAFDLIMSPASDRLGVHRVLLPSFRGRLLASCTVPLWTSGPALHQGQFRQGIRNVAYLVDYDHAPRARARKAAAFAARFGARLHALDVIPPVTDGTVLDVLDSHRPLMPARADEQIREMFDDGPEPAVDVRVGSRERELARMLRRCEADLLFVAPQHATRGVLRTGFARDLDRLPCPVVCLGASNGTAGRWSFESVESSLPRAYPAASRTRAS